MIFIFFMLDLRRRENAANKAKKNTANDKANNSVVLADVALRQQQQLLYQEKIIKEQNMKLRQQNDQTRITHEPKLHQSLNSNGSKNSTISPNSKQNLVDKTKVMSETTKNEQTVTKEETVKEKSDKNDDYLLLLPGMPVRLRTLEYQYFKFFLENDLRHEVGSMVQ